MKWVILGLIALGAVLIYLGNGEVNNRAQSADVRVGGTFLIGAGIGSIVLALITALAVFLWML